LILIFTNKEDAHPNLVIDILTERGVPFFRLNTEDLLTDYSFCWCANEGGCDFEIVNKQTGSKLIGSEISAIWDRRPEPPKSLPFNNTEEINAHNLREGLAFLRFLRGYVEHIPSIGSIVGDNVAASKMLQYRTAIDCGFIVPDTVFANGKTSIADLASKHDRLCLKPINGLDIWDEKNGVDYILYTQTLDSTNLNTIPEEAFLQTVSFVQEYVPKEYELRVTVVGNDVFATKILSQNLPEDKGRVDWRQGYGSGLRFETYGLPEEIQSKCISLVHKLNLNFGCIDLIVRPDGEYVFLECNPNGQWLWVELATGQPIAKSIADFLVSSS
jgi:glutathione synthase/RimK-type ligase-like ATP-grasp enzyme